MNFYIQVICEVVEFQGATEVKNEEDCLLSPGSISKAIPKFH